MIRFCRLHCTHASVETLTLAAVWGYGNMSEKTAELLLHFLTMFNGLGFFAPILPLSWVVTVEW